MRYKMKINKDMRAISVEMENTEYYVFSGTRYEMQGVSPSFPDLNILEFPGSVENHD